MRAFAAAACGIAVLCVSLAGCSHGAVDAPREDARIRQGRALYDRGQYESAETLFRDLLREAERDGDLLLQAQCQKWLGNLQVTYRKDDDALARYVASAGLLARLLRACDSAGAAPPRLALDERQNVLSNTAVVYKNKGRLNEAQDLQRQVLRYDEERGAPLPIAVSLTNLGAIALLRADNARLNRRDEQFRAYLDSAQRAFERSLRVYPTADAWLDLGTVHAFAQRRDSAVAAFRRANAIYQAEGYRVHEALCQGNIGILLMLDGKSDEAETALKTGIGIIEELRGGLTSIDVRSSFVSNKYYLYEKLVTLLLARGRVEEAFEYVERAKARSFLDMIGNKAIGTGKQRTREAENLVADERAMHDRIARLIDAPDSSAALVDLLARHRSVLDRLRDIDPEYASVKSIDPVPVKELQGMLDDTTAIVEYYIGDTIEEGDRVTYAFVVRRDTIVARRLRNRDETGRAEPALNGRVEGLRRKLFSDFPNAKNASLRSSRLQKQLTLAQAREAWLATPTDGSWQYGLMEMHTQWIAPIDTFLHGVTRLYIVPHGALHHLPFQALIRIGLTDRRPNVHVARPRYLIEDMAVAYLPSASVLPFAARRRPASNETGLVIGDPLYADAQYRKRPLEGALIEADSVSGFIAHPLVLKRADAEEAEVKRRVTGAGVVHFATHGELNKKDPMQSRILLAAAHPDSVNDGNLTVAEVFNLDMNAALVTLSACQTAQVSTDEGRISMGDEMVGLTRSFLYAGTPSVIASLWYVDDAATLAWMDNLYRAWLSDHMGRAEAARAAALEMLRNPGDPDWIFPYYWAAFIFLGEM
jgi:CHAT domain-containing protein/tetratricopeptide (TPR) repeat protein